MLTYLIDYYFEIEELKENIYIALKNRIRSCILCCSESYNNCEMLDIFISKTNEYSQKLKDIIFLADSVINYINGSSIYDYEANEDYFQFETIFSNLGQMLCSSNTNNIALCIIKKFRTVINVEEYLNKCNDSTRYLFSLYNIN
jgi:hypothetical protein